MDPFSSTSRNAGLSFYSYTVFKPTMLNCFASGKDRTQYLHIKQDFGKKKYSCSIHALCPVQSSNKSATFLYLSTTKWWQNCNSIYLQPHICTSIALEKTQFSLLFFPSNKVRSKNLTWRSHRKGFEEGRKLLELLFVCYLYRNTSFHSYNLILL